MRASAKEKSVKKGFNISPMMIPLSLPSRGTAFHSAMPNLLEICLDILFTRPQMGEQQHFADGAAIGQQHHQTVNA